MKNLLVFYKDMGKAFTNSMGKKAYVLISPKINLKLS